MRNRHCCDRSCAKEWKCAGTRETCVINPLNEGACYCLECLSRMYPRIDSQVGFRTGRIYRKRKISITDVMNTCYPIYVKGVWIQQI